MSVSDSKLEDTSFQLEDSPLVHIDRAWVLFLQNLFNENLAGAYRWHADENETGILIMVEGGSNGPVIHNRPIITVSTTMAQWAGVSMNPTMQLYPFEGDRLITDLLHSRTSINCVCKVPKEAISLAYYISRMIKIFEPQIVRLSKYLNGISNQIQVGPVSRNNVVNDSSFSSWRQCSVHVPITIQDKFIISPTHETYINDVKFKLDSIE